MKLATTVKNRTRQQGQTLVIALAVLGLLLILGIVFIGLLNRNIKEGSNFGRRSESTDLAEAGIRYAHGQLLRSEQGADWRGNPSAYAVAVPPTVPADGGVYAIDPDILYLRPAAVENGSGNPLPFRAGSPALDLGGPDGLGPYVRVPFGNGRALVRVRYAPSDANIFSSSPTGALRSPGAARNYLIIESIGRPGSVNPNDPTTLGGAPVKINNFLSQAEFQQNLGQLSTREGQNVASKKQVAFCPIGIIDRAWFITNKFRTTRAAEIGIPRELSSAFLGNDVATATYQQLGNPRATRFAGSPNPVPTGFGSLHSNADLLVNGRVFAALNQTLGDQITVAGSITAAQGARLIVAGYRYDPLSSNFLPLNPVPVVLGPGGDAPLDSRDSAYTTVQGLVRDGASQTDAVGFARGVSRLEPPSAQSVDPDTKRNRYVTMTRDSGMTGASGNAGAFGHGRGIYVDNTSDRQEPADEEGRVASDDEANIFNDWLNPNAEGGRWVGSYYVPRGAYVQLLADGWVIQRDPSGSPAERTWRNQDASDSGLSSIRFRLGWVQERDATGTPIQAGRLYVVNSLTPGVNINAAAGSVDFSLGQPFNGVLYFEGNVRVRGIIPTDVQLTLVSNGTVFIEGSILKGQLGNDVTSSYLQLDLARRGLAGRTGYGLSIDRPTRSSLMLMAKDHVAVNTTMFFGPSPTQRLQPKDDSTDATRLSGLLVSQESAGEGGDRLLLTSEFSLDGENQGGADPVNPLNPSTWIPLAVRYRQVENATNAATTLPLETRLLLAHATDPGVAPATFIGLNINPGLVDEPNAQDPAQVPSAYLFPGDERGAGIGLLTNTASGYLNQTNPAGYPLAAPIPIYGLGSDAWQRYNRYESRGFTIVDPANSNYANGLITSTTPGVRYRMFGYGSNDLLLRLSPLRVAGGTSNYVIARAAMAPHDIRIEASVFAEDGSFFVIPGTWFNPNPADTRADFVNGSGVYSGVPVANRAAVRLENFGTSPEIPFYGEPIDVKVTLVGSVSENMPPPSAVQSEWIRKWGWIPRAYAATGQNIPSLHAPADPDPGAGGAANSVLPNLVRQYDPVLATGRVAGFETLNDPRTSLRIDEYGRTLPPMPRLPVSPTLAFFGEMP